ncbi:MAG: hypothetical protein OXK79_08375 [Chloroflexota bacterium]|nr:hypothetical protein [Chloroflexota bacterium]
MNIIAIGCEYTGTTTLMLGLQEWMKGAFGQTTIFHDHFKLPNHSGHPPLDPDIIIFDEEEKRQILTMSPKLKELFSRYTLYYHTPNRPMTSTDFGGLHIGHHIDEMIYAPMYFGYGRPGEPGDRRIEAQNVEQGLMKYRPDTVLVLMRASAEVVRSRMRSAPHPDGVVRDEDIELVLQRFDEEFARSAIVNKITLDTTESTPEETFEEFLCKMEQFWTEGDRLRMLTHAG